MKISYNDEQPMMIMIEEDYPSFSSVVPPPTLTINPPSCAAAPPPPSKQEEDDCCKPPTHKRNCCHSSSRRPDEDTTSKKNKKNLQKKALDLERDLLQQYCNKQEEILRQNYQVACSGGTHENAKEELDLCSRDSINNGSSSALSVPDESSSLDLVAQVGGKEEFSSSKSALFTLITGPSGSYRIAQRALTTLQDNGYFLYARFDEQRGNMIPYSGWCQVISDLIFAAKRKGGEPSSSSSLVAAIGDTLRTTFAKRDRETLLRMIPCLAEILLVPFTPTPKEATINNKQSDESTSTNNKKKRPTNTTTAGFVQSVSKLLQILAKISGPLVIVLDDMQFADIGSIEILLQMTGNTQVQLSETTAAPCKLMIIGACDDSLMPGEQLKRLKDAAFSHIVAPILSKDQINNFLWESCRLEVQERKAFTDLAMQQTSGYIWDLIDFLHWSFQEGELLHPNTTTWSESYKYEAPTSSELELELQQQKILSIRLSTLPQSLQEMLQVASCLGSTFDKNLLKLVLVGEQELLVEQELEELVEIKTLQRAASHDSNGHHMYLFEPGVQRMAYQMMSKQRQKETHHTIGRRLWTSSLGSIDDTSDLDHKLFDVLSHLHIGGQELIASTTDMNIIEVASLCLQAGEKAVRASAFQTSALYLKFGIDILPERHWEKPQTYDLSLALYSAAAEVYTSSQATNYEEVERLLAIVLSKTRTHEEKVQANSSLMYVYSLHGKHIDCLDLGITVLKQLGLTFPKRLSKVFLLPDMIATNRLTGNKTNAQIMDMPTMTNKKKVMTLQILNHMVLPSILCRPNLTPFILLKMATITLKHGLSVFSSTAFGAYGMFRIKAAGDVRLATRFQEMAKSLLERFGADEYLPRTYVAIYGCTNAFSRPPSESLEPLMKAHHVGKSLGDVEYSGLAYVLCLLHVLEGGLSLKLYQEFRPLYVQMADDPLRRTLMRLALPGAEYADRLCGNLSDPLSPRGNFIDFEQYNREAVACGSVQNQIELRYRRMQLGYIFRDFDLAEANCLKLSDLEEFPPTCQLISVAFWIGLVSIHAAQNGRRRIRNILQTRRVCKRLTKWAEHAPHNVLDRKSLLQAELAAAFGDTERALENFRLAILCTESSKSLMVRALANERMGRYVLAKYDMVEARMHFTEAVKAYQDWGADNKATRLKDEMDAHFGPIIEDG